MENLDHILLFKTNINTPEDREALCAMLKELGADNWNLDSDDCDKVLRIISEKLKHQTIIQMMTARGYECCELV